MILRGVHRAVAYRASLEKLTIVAGALSVGIGFGLQSIVSNFVSGLILLWEGAIRVGDLVVVGTDQGYVRRIVCSTEIETFERATMVVPNSDLITGVVKNWVRSDRVGRVTVSVALHTAADPYLVRDIMIKAAKGHEQVSKIPAPNVLFVAMDTSALKFDLVCFVDDVETSGHVKSDLHFEIFKQFRAQNIVLATPMQVVVSVDQFPAGVLQAQGDGRRRLAERLGAPLQARFNARRFARNSARGGGHGDRQADACVAARAARVGLSGAPIAQEGVEPARHIAVVAMPAVEMFMLALRVWQLHALMRARGPAAHHGVGHFRVELQRHSVGAVAKGLHLG